MSNPKYGALNGVDDDLDGVDDFLDEPNPFDDTQNGTSNSNATVAPDLDTKSMATAVLPDYSEISGIQQEPGNEPYGNVNNGSSVNVNRTTTERGELPPGLINYYSKFFQLSTETFKGRFLRSLKINQLIFESESYNPESRELFGAIWITCTIVLVKFIFPGLINLMHYGIIKGEKISESVPTNDRDKIYWNLIHSIWLFGIYSFVVPFIVLQIILKDDTNGEENGLPQSEPTGDAGGRHMTINANAKNLIGLITVYGYGNSIWLFILPILDITNSLATRFKTAIAVEWAIIALAYVKTAQYMNMQICNRGNGHVRLPFTMIFVLGFHIIFSVLLMFTLY
ncbi:similar to Saccharomyces cerevisiae YGL161C YIP5 Protein that interacts with Rab GTPases, localized to late Golgi vesicles [Maudiozyma barnettii]|uniref:Similar to Saccharomyces cerevisiae YGL161C YIP5 Protein that interacts with Rab GTPases, localized to late Golgi vesicles n=1 Tax=Maudiozyma barnettii TaxID=61262 RepID=A0A8H2VBX9_9SACH|nr:Yip5p [Kazachstania barnettii]CAB4252457.1 similar to Saccharomyces cerevisiae YGL161C YIP5 Protein that interacts with Rab GTPases, localized to late Golgi vesicles [Kazachstania barnettii]CAD1779192.1 similar to Saccharomyces cerevisiae YGL161C YIP5 Protein that interacts with Rab GTPases, localized to late Golgi vesicles [Kazachstania barnettii]